MFRIVICKIGVFCSPGYCTYHLFLTVYEMLPPFGRYLRVTPLPVTVTRRFLAVVVTFRNYSVEHCPHKLGCHYLADRTFAWIQSPACRWELGKSTSRNILYPKTSFDYCTCSTWQQKIISTFTECQQKSHIKLHPRYLGNYISIEVMMNLFAFFWAKACGYLF